MTPPKPVLLVSLGTSPAIVPEAFLLPGVRFASVHVLTTERPEVGPIHAFFRDDAPGIPLTITRVAGFHDFTGEEDHFRFEEVLYRWILESGIPPEQRFICLSGGFKTMSAAMQRAATMLGAAEVFHVLADRCCTDADGKPVEPRTPDEVIRARDAGHLHHIRLGAESGWPQLRRVPPGEYPLDVVRAADGERWVRAADDAFRRRLQDLTERSHRIAQSWDRMAALPFPELATWSQGDLTWLNEPLEPAADNDSAWLAALPKVELHCHLGGFSTHGELLRQVRAAAADPAALPALDEPRWPEGWPLPAGVTGLPSYMKLGDAGGRAVLRDPGCLRRHCELLYRHLQDQRVVYAEIRCSPGNYAGPGRSPWTVLGEIRETFDACTAKAFQERAPVCRVNLLIIGTRRERGDYRSEISRHLALAVSAAGHWTDPGRCRVVGVDLAGFEDPETRAHYFREEFVAAHRCGLALTVHAGENDDAEGIWRAVFDLSARRLGHALHLLDSPDLLRSVADRGVVVEMCPYANTQIRGFRPVNGTAEYPLLAYLRRGVRVTINTDNIGISSASLTDNLRLAARLCPGLTRLDILQMQRHAIEGAFTSTDERTRLSCELGQSIPTP